jgi:hypothetical protein
MEALTCGHRGKGCVEFEVDKKAMRSGGRIISPKKHHLLPGLPSSLVRANAPVLDRKDHFIDRMLQITGTELLAPGLGHLRRSRPLPVDKSTD